MDETYTALWASQFTSVSPSRNIIWVLILELFWVNLNLVLQDGIKKNPNSEMENTLVKKLSVLNFIKGSPKRYEIFREMVEQDFY